MSSSSSSSGAAPLSVANAISPIDGRYWRKVNALAAFASEASLFKHRVLVEVESFVALCESAAFRRRVPDMLELSDDDRRELRALYAAFVEPVLGYRNRVVEPGQGEALVAVDQFEHPGAAVLRASEVHRQGPDEALTEADVDEIRLVDVHLEAQMVDHRRRAVEEHRRPEVPDGETEFGQQRPEGTVVLETPPAPALVDDLGHRPGGIGANRQPGRDVEVLERDRGEMGPLQSLQRGEIEFQRAAVSDPAQVGVDVEHRASLRLIAGRGPGGRGVPSVDEGRVSGRPAPGRPEAARG